MKAESGPEYAAGAQAFRDGEPFDHTQSYQWRIGFGDAVTIAPIKEEDERSPTMKGNTDG